MDLTREALCRAYSTRSGGGRSSVGLTREALYRLSRREEEERHAARAAAREARREQEQQEQEQQEQEAFPEGSVR